MQQTSLAVVNQPDDLTGSIEDLIFAKWRYSGCQLIQRSGGWQVYNSETDTFLGGGFPTVHWDTAYAQTFATKVQALDALAHAKHPPRAAGGKDWRKTTVESPRTFEGAIKIDALVYNWKDEKIIKPAPPIVEQPKLPQTGIRNRLAGMLEKWAASVRPNDSSKGFENG